MASRKQTESHVSVTHHSFAPILSKIKLFLCKIYLNNANSEIDAEDIATYGRTRQTDLPRAPSGNEAIEKGSLCTTFIKIVLIAAYRTADRGNAQSAQTGN